MSICDFMVHLNFKQPLLTKNPSFQGNTNHGNDNGDNNGNDNNGNLNGNKNGMSSLVIFAMPLYCFDGE